MRARRAAHLRRDVTALNLASLAAASSAVLAAMRPRSEGSAEPGSGAPPLVRTRPETGVDGDATLAAKAAASARASGTREALSIAQDGPAILGRPRLRGRHERTTRKACALRPCELLHRGMTW